MRVNYYEVLGIERTATETAIRDRFRQLAREAHPDRFQGDEKARAELAFQNLTEAVNVLTNAARRRQHDAELQSSTGGALTDLAQVARAYTSLGVKAYKEGDFAKAVENFDLAVKHNPQDAKAYHHLALASAKMPALMRQAVQAIEMAVQREPYNFQYLKDAGMLSRRAGLTAKAERYFEQALSWDKENAEIKTALAELRQGKDSKDGGKGLLDSFFKKG
jgi:curved DNA-binding protein CbpA